MTDARDQVYSFVNRMAQFAMRNPNGLDYRSYQSVEAGSGCYEDLELRALLNQVEDDRVHAEAERIREEAKATADAWTSEVNRDRAERASGAMCYVADLIDPYEERDGQLVRKSDGVPVVI